MGVGIDSIFVMIWDHHVRTRKAFMAHFSIIRGHAVILSLLIGGLRGNCCCNEKRAAKLASAADYMSIVRFRHLLSLCWSDRSNPVEQYMLELYMLTWDGRLPLDEFDSQ
jgi:hypothetical protein